jgi:hypothetical protein
MQRAFSSKTPFLVPEQSENKLIEGLFGNNHDY